MPAGHSEPRSLADAVAICARVTDELGDMRQTLGLERAGADDVALSAVAGELQVIQTNVDDLRSLLEALQREQS